MKIRKAVQRLLLVLCFGLLLAVTGHSARLMAAEGENTAQPVKPVSIDYEELWLVVDAGDNTAVYYSDKAQKVWTEAVKDTDGKYYIDISWLKSTSNVAIALKGDRNDEVVSIPIAARESKFKVKFDKVKGTLSFTSLPADTVNFEWRKATSYEWHTVSVADAGKADSAFGQEIEKLRVAGASIYVRLPQEKGVAGADGTFGVGKRQSKEVKVSISKRVTAPKIKINGAKLLLNTTTAMEYSTDNGKTWTKAAKNMSLETVAPGALGTGAKDVTVWFRKAATAKAGYSKTFVLEIPAQRTAPTVSAGGTAEVSYESSDGKFYLSFSSASKTSPYEYTVVKSGSTLDMAKASWRAVTSAKKISVSPRTAPEGSTIYVRKKMTSQTKTTEFALASVMGEIPVSY